MGTTVRLSVPRSEYAPSVLEEAIAAVKEVDRRLSVHREDSELNRLNRESATWHRASDALIEVARAALRFGNATDGALDVTVLPVLRRLGFMPATSDHPKGGPEVVDYRQLRIDGENVLLESGGYAVDFGGIAKGFAVDQAIAELTLKGVKTGLIDAGGDLFGMGRPETDRRWRIGIRDPFQPDTLFATLEIENEAVATSGIYAQTIQRDGKKISHIIDPSTCQPVDHVASATVVTGQTMSADALATAISVLPVKAGLALIETLEDTEALWVHADRRITMSTGMRSRARVL
jgi:thiamine biosynthesis lipoprotein